VAKEPVKGQNKFPVDLSLAIFEFRGKSTAKAFKNCKLGNT